MQLIHVGISENICLGGWASARRGLRDAAGAVRFVPPRRIASRRDPIGKADRQTLEAFYLAHYGRVYQFVSRSVRNREEAEDLTAQVFLKVVSGLDEARGAKAAQLWLYRLMRTTIADYWRTRVGSPTCSLEALLAAGGLGPAVDPPAMSEAVAQRVQRLLQALPHRHREVLTCRFLLQLSIQDTALRMGLTVADVKVLQLRALKRAAELETITTDG